MKRACLFVLAALIVCMISAPLIAQQTTQRVGQAVKHGTAPTVQELMKRAPLAPPKAFGAEKEVVNRVPDSLMNRPPVVTVADPLAQTAVSQLAPTAGLSFGGYDSDDNASLFGFRTMPPDVEGDVGLTYYVQYNNLGWKYFNKSDGSLAGGPFAGNIFWQGFGGVCETDNAGDPIVLYDQFADRWVFSQFTDPGNPDGHQCFAITQPGAGPGGPYYLYDFVVSPGQFNDYEKITVWTDGAGQSAYHMSSNEFAGSFAGVNATAFDRDAMLAGGAASFVQASLGTATGTSQNFSLQPSHLEGLATPPAGTCNKYIQAFDNETWGSGPGPDGYRIWTYCVNFTTPAASTFAETAFITSAAFDAELCGYSRDCVPQPGTTQRLDVLGQFTMYRFATRYISGGLRGVISHTVDTGGDVAGSRWAEINLDNDTILDSGTLTPSDGVSRWMPSISMDGSGNIGMGFTKSSAGVNPSVYFTGRETGDAPGTLQAEVVCIDGTGSQLGGNRWGDYSTVSVDPSDDCTFWITNEYVETTGSFQWDTQICSYSFPSCGVSQTCGNNVIEGSETCDGTDLGGASCSGQGCSGGTLACNGTCTGFDTSGCTGCPTCNNNGTCELGEDCNSCPNDCASGTSSGAVCGNGTCEAGNGEDCVSCPSDCNGVQSGKPSNRFCCGDGDGQNPLPCSDSACSSGGFQCTDVPVSGGGFCCGDLTCDSGESCGNCALDCTTGAEVCTGGIDEDCDGDVDCNDTDCASDPACSCVPSAEVCNNGVDDDCDLDVDCDDSDCSSDPACSCLPKNASCSLDNQCCSGDCKNNGRCR